MQMHTAKKIHPLLGWIFFAVHSYEKRFQNLFGIFSFFSSCLIQYCSYPEYVGLYVAAPAQSNEEDVHDSQNEETISFSDNEEPFLGSESVQEPLDEVQTNVSDWDGTYVCNNGGEDGTKTLTATKNGNTLTFEISHTYGDGRSDFISGSADIGTYGNGSAFASYENEKILYFTWSGNTIEISQIGIYPDVDLEFSGLYTKSN